MNCSVGTMFNSVIFLWCSYSVLSAYRLLIDVLYWCIVQVFSLVVFYAYAIPMIKIRHKKRL